MTDHTTPLTPPEDIPGGDGREENTHAGDGGASETSPDTGRKQKKKRKPYVDDGHTVYDMSALDDPRERAARRNRVSLSHRERWAVIRAAFLRFAPPMLLTILGFLAAMLLIRLWLL